MCVSIDQLPKIMCNKLNDDCTTLVQLIPLIECSLNTSLINITRISFVLMLKIILVEILENHGTNMKTFQLWD